MLHASGLVPTRFLTLLAHLILSLTLLMSREENVKACLPFEYAEEDYARKDVELATGLGVAVGLLVIELLGELGIIYVHDHSLAPALPHIFKSRMPYLQI